MIPDADGQLKRARCLTLWLSAACLLGCSRQDFSRPIGNTAVFRAIDSGTPYTVQSDEGVADERATRMTMALDSWKEKGREAGGDYCVGVGDVLHISILALSRPEQRDEIVRSVGRDGAVNVPLVGDVQVNGLTVWEIEATVRKAYTGRFLKNPQITVTVGEFRSKAVVLTGAVGRPGIYYLQRNRMSLLELLAEADGLSEEAGDDLLVIRCGEGSGTAEAGGGLAHAGAPGAPPVAEMDECLVSPPVPRSSLVSSGSRVIPIDARHLIDQGDLRLNLWIGGGDIILVRLRKREFIYVLGYVQRAGAFEMPKDAEVGVLQAVAMAGGLASMARAENSMLIREEDGGEEVIPLDLTKIAQGIRPTSCMQPGDTLVVGSGIWARLSEFVRPSVGVGASYAPVP